MFEVGFTEIILILGLALLVLGPEKLPALAEKIGRWTGRARSMARQLRTQLEHEVTLEELAKSKPMQASKPATPEPVADPPPPAGFDLDQHFAAVDTTPDGSRSEASTGARATPEDTTMSAAGTPESDAHIPERDTSPEAMHAPSKIAAESQSQ